MHLAKLPGWPKLIKSGKRGRPRKEYNTNEKNKQISQAVDTMSAYDNPTIFEVLSEPFKHKWKDVMLHCCVNGRNL